MQITNIIPRTVCDVHINIFTIESRDLLHSNPYTKNIKVVIFHETYEYCKNKENNILLKDVLLFKSYEQFDLSICFVDL